MSQEEFDLFLLDIEQNLDLLNEEELQDVQSMVQKIDYMAEIEKARTDFKTFCKLCGPPWLKFSSKGQHDLMCEKFKQVVDGNLKRVTISMAPRMGKSIFGSVLLPAWFIGKYPDKKIIQASSVDTRAIEFGRQVKGMIDSPMFRRIFPTVTLSKDSKASGRFATNHGGTYYAVGVNSAVAGIGADLFVCLPKGEKILRVLRFLSENVYI